MTPACGGSGDRVPDVAVAGSVAAQQELRKLEERWELSSSIGRRELRPELEDFVQKYRTDPSVARARLLLAQIALVEERFGAVEEVLAPLLSSQGSARDEAQVILAALDNRRGHYEKALSRLSPLQGKLLSADARDQYARERTLAAMKARKWRLTMEAMTNWLTEPGTDQKLVREWIASAIIEMPPRALSRLLADWPESEGDPKKEAASDWLRRHVIEHLTTLALASRDAMLARDLLKWSPTWLRTGKSGDELSILAALAQKDAQIVGRSIGVVLGGDSADERRRSVRVGLGVMRGIQAEATRTKTPGVQFLSSERRGSLSAALSELSSLGASILVAGVEEKGASEALAFGEKHQVPVVVLSDPGQTQALSFGFIFGEGASSEMKAAEQALPEVEKWAIVGGESLPCPSEVSRPGTLTFPFSDWRQTGVSGVLLLGDEACARRFSREAASLAWRPSIVLGLESAHSSSAALSTAHWLSVGQFPVRQALPAGDQISDLERALSEGEAPPEVRPRDWYFTLGVDVATLASRALGTLPESAATLREEVRKRHQLARDALLRATAALTSTDAGGFAGRHRIARTLSVVKDEAARDK